MCVAHSRTRSTALIGTAILAIALWFVAPAYGAQVEPIQVENLDSAVLRVDVASDDPTSTATVAVNGVAVDVRTVSPGDSYVVFCDSLSEGAHQATLTLRSGLDPGFQVVESEQFRIWHRPMPAQLITPGRYAAATTPTLVKVGASTTRVAMYVNGVWVKELSAVPDTLLPFGEIALRAGANEITLVAANPVESTTTKFTVTRLDFPWPTCIIIDKSEYRLYWVRDGQLVKVYPIAIGKAHTPTPVAIWRIDAKYHTDPAGVYGPRKMRMFRQTSSGFTYTAYAVHGTNEPWVIGSMASHGCVRMYNWDVLELFPQVPLGTMVQTRP